MGERRPLPSFTAGDYDIPPATITLADNSMTRLDRLGRALERQREEAERQREEFERSRETLRQRGWVTLPGLRRRRWLRTSGTRSPTYEGWASSRRERSPDEDNEQPREAKRRKIPASPTFHDRSYKYGHYGQVEPGRLKLELCSCDGGVHNHRDTGHYGPTNILKHDQSVYSSKSPRCNIILQHHDGSVFALEKLTIIAPHYGFTAPVKQGTVCVAMGYNDLMPLTAQDLLDDDDKAPSPDPGQDDHGEDDEDDGDEERLGLLESLNDPRVLAATSTSNNDDSWPPAADWLPQPLPSANRASNRDGRIWDISPGWPPLEPSTRVRISRPGPTSTETLEQFSLDSGLRVTIDQEHDLGPPEPATREEVRRRARDERLAALDALESSRTAARSVLEGSSTSATGRGRRTGTSQTRSCGVQTGESTQSSTPNVTQVPFEIPDGISSVTIKFDPPVSGTCLLLRMQAKPQDTNVDIQTVIASGYAGPRFFPALKMK